MTVLNTETAAPDTVVAEQGANVAQERASSKKAARAKKSSPRGQKNPKGAKPKAAAMAKPKKAVKAVKAPKESKQPKAEGVREGSKTAKVLDLLKRSNGATLKELMKTTGWQPHSLRGFLSGTVGKKLRLALASTKGEDGERRYSLGK